MSNHDLYTRHADTIETVLAYTCRSNRLTADAGDEFSSWARLKLIDHDCAVLRKFQERSSFRTFLITVITHLFSDWRIKEWGKWRPSTAARRQGPVAIELERLIIRDGTEYEQAVEILVTRGTALSRAECDELWAVLPRRPRRRQVPEEVIDVVPMPSTVDPVEVEEQRERAARVSDALSASLPMLPAQEQLMIKLRYVDQFTVPRIAKLIGEADDKPLYRRFEQIVARLGQLMAGHGVSSEDTVGLFGNPVVEFPSILGERGTGKPDSGPSPSSNAGGGV